MALYASTWLSMVMLLDAVALVAITGFGARCEIPDRMVVARFPAPARPHRARPDRLGDGSPRHRRRAADRRRPRAAAVLLTVAAWIKVWPAALVAAIVIAARARWRVLAAALGTSAIIVAIAFALGSGANVLSFVTEQNARGLQLEAPVSTPWLWQAYVHTPGALIYYDTTLLTWQVAGDGVALVVSLMMPSCCWPAPPWRSSLSRHPARCRRRRGAAALVLALVTALIAFNKVGSPQFMAWLSVPVVLGLAAQSPDGGLLSGARGARARAGRAHPVVLPVSLPVAVGPEPGDAHAAQRPECTRPGTPGMGRCALWRSRRAVSREQSSPPTVMATPVWPFATAP